MTRNFRLILTGGIVLMGLPYLSLNAPAKLLIVDGRNHKEISDMQSDRLNLTIPALTIYKEMRGASLDAKLWVAWVMIQQC